MELHSLEKRLAVFKSDDEKADQVQASIASLRTQVPATVLTHHDHLRSRGKRSVVEVRNGVCCGCHLGLSSGLFADMRRGGDLHRCENCGRFLYLVEEDAAVPEVKVPAKRRSAAVTA